MSEHFVLSSPHFTRPYPHNAKIAWRFTASDEQYFIIKPGKVVYMDEYDSLTFGKGEFFSNSSLLYRYPHHLRYSPKSIGIRGRNMWARFTSDEYESRAGFYLLLSRQIRHGNARFFFCFCFCFCFF